MPGDYYSDAAPAAEPSPAPEGKPEGGEGQGGDESTAVLPKSILAGKKFDVGDEVVLKIVAMHDNEVEVQYAQGEGGKETEAAEPAAPEPATPPSGMASMMG